MKKYIGLFCVALLATGCAVTNPQSIQNSQSSQSSTSEKAKPEIIEGS